MADQQRAEAATRESRDQYANLIERGNKASEDIEHCGSSPDPDSHQPLWRADGDKDCERLLVYEVGERHSRVLTDEIRAAIRANKPELLRELADEARPRPSFPPWIRTSYSQRRVRRREGWAVTAFICPYCEPRRMLT